MQNKTIQTRRTRARRGKTVVAREAGFSIRTKGNGFIVQIRREGLRETKTFPTLDAAKLYCQQLDTTRTNEGLSAFALTPAQRDDARRALAMLESRASLVAVTKAWLRMNPANGGTTFADLAPMLLDSLEAAGRRARTIEQVRQYCAQFSRDFGTRVISTIARDEIEQWLAARHPGRSFNGVRAILSGAFTFAVRQRYADANQVAGIAAKKFDREEPHFWPVETVAAVLRAAAALDAEKAAARAQEAAKRFEAGKAVLPSVAPLLPVFALSAFAGLRPAEAARLDWQNINFDEAIIRIPANVSKVRRARLVPMEKNVVAWLQPYRKTAGPVAPSADTIKRGRAEILEKAGLPAQWPQDVLRHSFATYWMAAHSHEGQLAEMLGNSPAIIQRHYKGLATAKEGAKYFKIEPPAEGNVIQLRQAVA